MIAITLYLEKMQEIPLALQQRNDSQSGDPGLPSDHHTFHYHRKVKRVTRDNGMNGPSRQLRGVQPQLSENDHPPRVYPWGLTPRLPSRAWE